MAVTNPVNNSASLTRLMGMSSGMDTETLVKGLMQYDRFKLEREMRSRTLMQWKQEALTQTNNDLRDFRQKFMSVLSSDNLLSGSVYNQFKVETFGEFKDAVTIKAGEGANGGTITVDYVKQLAAGARVESSRSVSGTPPVGLINQQEAIKNGKIDDSLDTALKDLNFANSLTPEGGDMIIFEINQQRFEFKTDTTLRQMMNTINTNEKAGVTMSYNRLTDSFSIENKETGFYKKNGDVNGLTIKNVLGNAFGDMENVSSFGAFGMKEGAYVNGKNAIVSINGKETKTQTSNTLTVEGVTITLNDVFNTDNISGKGVRATLSRDIEPTVEKIKGFVDAYNELLNKLNTMVTERKSKDEKMYTPLTDDEKSQLTDKQLEEWEKLAKKGLLNNDGGIQRVIQQLRSALYDAVSSAGISAADVGLRTGSWEKQGQIELDEDMLRDALNRDPDKVMRVFTAFAKEEAEGTEAYNQNGFLNRISDIISNYSTTSNTASVQTLNRTMSDLDKRISAMEDRMADLEERYFKKFAAMESLISKMQSQSSWIGNNMGM